MIVNKRAKYDYDLLETYEGGLLLKGFEVKAIREGKMRLEGSFIIFKTSNGKTEALLINAYISPYQPANTPAGYDPERSRKVLLHKSEITSLLGKIKQKSLTLVPICVYNKRKKIKLEFALAKGKREIDKRETIKKREVDREIRRKMMGM